MSKDARSEDLDLTSEAKVKFDELVPLLARTDRRAKPPSHKSNSSAIRPGGWWRGRSTRIWQRGTRRSLPRKNLVPPATRSARPERVPMICLYRPRTVK